MIIGDMMVSNRVMMVTDNGVIMVSDNRDMLSDNRVGMICKKSKSVKNYILCLLSQP